MRTTLGKPVNDKGPIDTCAENILGQVREQPVQRPEGRSLPDVKRQQGWPCSPGREG